MRNAAKIVVMVRIGGGGEGEFVIDTFFEINVFLKNNGGFCIGLI